MWCRIPKGDGAFDIQVLIVPVEFLILKKPL